MTRYEVYLLDQEGRVRRSKWVTQIDDQHALTAAAALVEDGSACQVWEYGRLVGEFCAAERVAADARESPRMALARATITLGGGYPSPGAGPSGVTDAATLPTPPRTTSQPFTRTGVHD